MAILPYPLANADALPIPFDVLNPRASVILPVSTSPMTQSLDLLAPAQGVLQFYAIGDYIQVGFGQVPITQPPTGSVRPDTLLLIPNVVYATAVVSNYISAVSLHQGANLLVNILDGWHAAGVNKQYESI